MLVYRIADGRFPIFDGQGAARNGGRWNSVGRPVIYAAETYSGAILEVLVHLNLGHMTKHQMAIEIRIPDHLKLEILKGTDLPDWDADDQLASRNYGDRWLEEMRTAVLFVPSKVTHGKEHNVLLNPNHPDFRKIISSEPLPVAFDQRLVANNI
jgi:RES domain-containing protein